MEFLGRRGEAGRLRHGRVRRELPQTRIHRTRGRQLMRLPHLQMPVCRCTSKRDRPQKQRAIVRHENLPVIDDASVAERQGRHLLESGPIWTTLPHNGKDLLRSGIESVLRLWTQRNWLPHRHTVFALESSAPPRQHRQQDHQCKYERIESCSEDRKCC